MGITPIIQTAELQESLITAGVADVTIPVTSGMLNTVQYNISSSQRLIKYSKTCSVRPPVFSTVKSRKRGEI